MPKRRANGEGNIRKRKDGRWEGRYTAGYDQETGKRIIKNVLGKTQAEVKEKLPTTERCQPKSTSGSGCSHAAAQLLGAGGSRTADPQQSRLGLQAAAA